MSGILCIGQAVADVTIPLDGPLIENQKYELFEERFCGGGPAFNAACLCARWGAESYLAACIGSDERGKKIRNSLLESRVKTDFLKEWEGSRTAYSYIVVNRINGNRTVLNFPGAWKNAELPEPETNIVPDVILADAHEPDMTLEALERWPEAKSVIDAGSCREYVMRVAPHMQYLVASRDFAEQLTGKTIDPDDMSAAEDIFSEVEKVNGGLPESCAAVTLGDQGVLYRDASGVLRRMEAFSVKAVDTTGAGDLFHGAFAWALAEGKALPEILRISQAAAALSVTKPGGYPSIPEREAVKTLLVSAGV